MERTVQKGVHSLSSAQQENIVEVKPCQHLQLTAQLVTIVWEALKQTDQQMGSLGRNVQRVLTVLRVVPHQHHVLMVLSLIPLRMKRLRTVLTAPVVFTVKEMEIKNPLTSVILDITVLLDRE